MDNTSEARWENALQGKGDGAFLYGVRTTGIYCLPSCRARKPLRQNVVFFDTEAEAAAFGLRPCRKCRPDYFYRNFDPDKETLCKIVTRVAACPENWPDVAALSHASGLGGTKLCALFREHFHTTPSAFLRRARINAACKILTDSAASVTETAFAAGYASLSAFHAQFRAETGLAPGAFRDFVNGSVPSNDFSLTVPRIVWNTARRVACRDTRSASERPTEHGFAKAFVCGSQTALLHFERVAEADAENTESPGNTKNTDDCVVRVRVDAQAHSPEVRRAAHRAAVRLLGVAGGGSEQAAWEARADGDPLFAALLGSRRGLRVPLTADVWESVAWAIIGQQINLQFAYSLRRAVTEITALGANAAPSRDGLTPFPSAQSIAALEYDDLTVRQFSRRKAEYLVDTARAVAKGALCLDALSGSVPFGDAEKTLLAVRGIGPWSAHYILMRGCGWADCIPIGDTGVASGLRRLYGLDYAPDKAEQERLMKPFAPFRSLATHHLWASLLGEVS